MATYYMTFNNNVESLVQQIHRISENYSISNSAKVVVFDLDDTIINDKDEIVGKNFTSTMDKLKNLNYIVGIWSHGNFEHVKYNCEKNLKNIFDFVFTRINPNADTNKSINHLLRYLHEKYKITRLSTAILVDDLHENENDDYNLFIEIKNGPIRNFDKILRMIVEFEKKL